MYFVVYEGWCPMSCLVLGLVRWPVVSVPSVLDTQGWKDNRGDLM